MVRRVEELEGKGQAAYSEGITDTIRVLQLFTQESVGGSINSLLLAERCRYQGEGRGKQMVVRVQRRVRMGKRNELGSPYILSPS